MSSDKMPQLPVSSVSDIELKAYYNAPNGTAPWARFTIEQELSKRRALKLTRLFKQELQQATCGASTLALLAAHGPFVRGESNTLTQHRAALERLAVTFLGLDAPDRLVIKHGVNAKRKVLHKTLNRLTELGAPSDEDTLEIRRERAALERRAISKRLKTDDPDISRRLEARRRLMLKNQPQP